MTGTERGGRWFRRTGAICFLALLFARPAAALEEPAAREFPVLSAMVFQVASPYRISHGELTGLVTLKPGDLLTPDAVRESIRRLYAKSLFLQISAYVREEAGKAILLFYLRPSPVVSDIQVVGAKRVTEAMVISASRIRKGVSLAAAELSSAEDAIRKMLREKGFPAAAVTVSASCSVETGAGKVRIEIREEDSGVIQSIAAEGVRFFPPERLRELLDLEEGARYDFRDGERGIRNLRAAYKKAGFLTVHVSPFEVSCREGEGVCLAGRVEEGPEYEVRWKGEKNFSRSKLEQAIRLHGGEEEFTEGGLAYDLRERLLSFYREKKYLKAGVTVETGKAEDGKRFLEIVLEEGEAGYLKEVRFLGNDRIPTKVLKKQMLSRERGFFHHVTGSGEFAESDWNADLAALVGLYQQEGYARMRISSVDTSWDEQGGITATIHVEEGPRYLLREVLLSGNDHFLREELLSLIGNRAGRYVNYVGLERDQETLAEFYRNTGYLDAVVQATLAFDEGKDTAVARFEIAEGIRYHRGTVAVRGNLLTDSAAIFREVTIPEGAPAGERDLLAFQQAVFGTGLYKSVRLNRLKSPERGIVDLIVEVEETLFFEIEYGVGYGTDTGLRGFAGAKTRNLNGLGRRLSVRVLASQKEQNYLADLREPWIFGNRWKWEGGLTGSYQEAERESFSLRKASAVSGISKKILLRSSVAVQYEFSRDEVFDVDPGAILSPEDQGTANIAVVRGIFVLDFRDDPFNPRRGSFHSGTAELASTYFGSEVDYYKVFGQTSWYYPLFRRYTVVLSGRAGLVLPMRDTLEVPIQKRFFLGGRTTVRGFKEESIGLLGTDGAPVGGDYMVNGNAEIRVPLQYGFIGALFLDAGSVWLEGGQGDRFDLRESAGVGLRYLTPVGPVGFDYGWKLDRRAGESGSEWHFTIGAVF